VPEEVAADENAAVVLEPRPDEVLAEDEDGNLVLESADGEDEEDTDDEEEEEEKEEEAEKKEEEEDDEGPSDALRVAEVGA